MLHFDAGDLIPFVVLSIPVIAVIGGVVAGILKTMGRQRLLELAQRERIAAIERGMDPSKLPSIPLSRDHAWLEERVDNPKRRAQGLMIGGVITLAVGIGLTLFLSAVEEEGNAWAVGIIPTAVGIGLLISSWLVWPRNNIDSRTALPPQ